MKTKTANCVWPLIRCVSACVCVHKCQNADFDVAPKYVYDNNNDDDSNNIDMIMADEAN